MKQLQQPLRGRVNRLAHRLATEHEQRLKDALAARLVALLMDGGYDAASSELERLERSAGGGAKVCG